jgi:hypothetical protein
MKINYYRNEEIVNNLFKAITYEKCDMSLTLNDEAIQKQEAIVRSETSTDREKEVARVKIQKLWTVEAEIKKQQEEVADVHELICTEIAKTENEHHASNDLIAVRNVLRLSCCDENNKFFKLAILTDDTKFDSFYNAMVSLHDMENEEIGNNGLRQYSKNANETANNLAGNIQSLIKQMFSIPIENEYTQKVNIKFNKSDMNAVHECFVTGLKVDKTKNKDGIDIDGVSFRYAIEKRQKQDGTIEYKGVRFKETLAKLAFARLFRVKSTPSSSPIESKTTKKSIKTAKKAVTKKEESEFLKLDKKEISETDLDIIHDTYPDVTSKNLGVTDKGEDFEEVKLSLNDKTITVYVCLAD